MTKRTSKILIGVVDDEPSVRRAVERLLRSAGFAVLTFASGEDLLEEWPEPKPACLILDVHLRGMSGFELQEQLVARGCVVPIIFITAVELIRALGENWRQHVARQLGSAGLLLKPFDEQALFDKIDEVMRFPSSEPTPGHAYRQAIQ